jgi:putative endopeptidase
MVGNVLAAFWQSLTTLD